VGLECEYQAVEGQFESLLNVPALRAFLAPRLVTHGLTSVREYFRHLLRHTNQDTAPAITCPSYVTDNETDTISVGQGKVLFDRCAAPVSASRAALTNLVKHAGRLRGGRRRKADMRVPTMRWRWP
jgi:hypothetical protein